MKQRLLMIMLSTVLTALIVASGYFQTSKAQATQLQWFGYTGGADDVMLDGTASYINFGYISTDANAASTVPTSRINAMAQRNMKAIVELGLLLWEPGSDGRYRTLYPDYINRWNTWKQANSSVLTDSKVLGFLVRDEPFHNGVNPYHFQAAAQMVKQDFPWAKIIFVEAAVDVADDNPYSLFNQYYSVISTIDWMGAIRYPISNPSTDNIFISAVTKLKARYPGRKFIYVADGYWDASHINTFGNDINIMRNVMTRWYDAARNDPDAVLLGVFHWEKFTGILAGSREFPPYVLQEQIRVGRAITGRTRSQLYLPTGLFEGFTSPGIGVGWACDPDGAWGETVRVDFYEVGGGYITSTFADRSSEFFPQCRSGIAHRFQMPFSIGTLGKQITAYAWDLNAGMAQLPSNCLYGPGCAWYNNDYQTIGEFRISSTGLAEGWTCDQDAPAVSLKLQIYADALPPTQFATLVGTFNANLASDETINSQCGGGAAHRFAVQLPSWTKGRPIGILGLDTMQGTNFLLADPNGGGISIGYAKW